MPDSATTAFTAGSVATARTPKRHFDLAETDAAATASARDDAPSVIRATTKSAAAVAEAAAVTPAVVARKPVTMIPLVAASGPTDAATDTVSGTATDTASDAADDKAEGGCCGGGCCS